MRRVLAITAAVVALTIAVNASLVLPPPDKVGATEQTVVLGQGIAPRFMWGWGPGLRGYCGETSFQSIGLYFGNYVSAEHYRNAADGKELLIAVNDEKAAKAMKYTYEEWNYNQKSPQGSNFIDWAATHIDAGHGVISGMFEQLSSGGDADYDHIMPIVAYKRQVSSSMTSNTKKKDGPTLGARSDVVGIYYNDLYRNQSLYGPKTSAFIKTRSQCKPASGKTPSSAPYEFCMQQDTAYGIALTGVQDTKGELFSTQLFVSSWTEPDWGEEDKLHQAIVEFTASVYVSGLTPGNSYTILRFDTANAVPTSAFSQGAFTKRFDFTATGYSYQLNNFDTFRSDSTIFYRTVAGF